MDILDQERLARRHTHANEPYKPPKKKKIEHINDETTTKYTYSRDSRTV